MRILHVNTYPYGGAFTGAYRLHKALLKNGVESKMLVSTHPILSILCEVFIYDKAIRKSNFFNRVLSELGFPVTANQKKKIYTKGLKGEYEIISFPFSDVDITESDEFHTADLIHLHWIAGFVDYKSFFKKCNKPIVFTLRDLNPVQGIFHYEEDKLRNLDFNSLEKKYIHLKSTYLNRFKGQIQIVGISDWITEKSRNSIIFKDLPHSVIHNCINTEEFEFLDKKKARRNLNIPLDSLVLSFVSDDVRNRRKGIDILREAILELPIINNLVILTVGKNSIVKFPINIVHRHLGECNNAELSNIYSASDAFIFPSREEALGNVMLEAMACGTPVIGTPVGGLLDVIKPGFNGLLSKDISAEGLKSAIIDFIEIRSQFNSLEIRNFICNNFSEELIAEEYIQLYTKILESYKS